MNNQEKVLQRLDDLGISYEIVQHSAVYTIEDMVALGLGEKGSIVKNLFLRDDKGKNHFLVLLAQDKKADLEKLRSQLNSTKLGFASEQRLDKYLGLSKGAVSPLGIINDTDHAVNVVFDKDLTTKDKLGVHPNDNTATVFISFDDLKKIIEMNGNKIVYLKI
ncbi:MAG: prolyl-tRNA synthetase associated domain-containing protein [Ruminiclostridium sp.]|nr:prolyl-tRNA synthetase associated domain-containing protein [Ruminiclostridium sp.]